MPYKKKRIDRDQVMITSFDSLVEPESIARIIDFFVDHVDQRYVELPFPPF